MSAADKPSEIVWKRSVIDGEVIESALVELAGDHVAELKIGCVDGMWDAPRVAIRVVRGVRGA